MAAENAGTWVFSIAYEADNDNCPASDNLPDGTTMTGACAMHLLADNPATDTNYPTLADAEIALCEGQATQLTDAGHRFYSQAAAGDLTNIFTDIGFTLTSTRLISDSAS